MEKGDLVQVDTVRDPTSNPTNRLSTMPANYTGANPMPKGHQENVPQKMQAKHDEIVALTDTFSQAHLTAE